MRKSSPWRRSRRPSKNLWLLNHLQLRSRNNQVIWRFKMIKESALLATTFCRTMWLQSPEMRQSSPKPKPTQTSHRLLSKLPSITKLRATRKCYKSKEIRRSSPLKLWRIEGLKPAKSNSFCQQIRSLPKTSKKRSKIVVILSICPSARSSSPKCSTI